MGIDKELHIGENVHIILVLGDIRRFKIYKHNTARCGAEHHVYIPFCHLHMGVLKNSGAAEENLDADG